MLISTFKAQCIAALDEVQRTGDPLVVTRRGVPIVRVEPVEGAPVRALGQLKGRFTVHCDLVHADTTDDWELPS